MGRPSTGTVGDGHGRRGAYIPLIPSTLRLPMLSSSWSGRRCQIRHLPFNTGSGPALSWCVPRLRQRSAGVSKRCWSRRSYTSCSSSKKLANSDADKLTGGLPGVCCLLSATWQTDDRLSADPRRSDSHSSGVVSPRHRNGARQRRQVWRNTSSSPSLCAP